MNASHGIVLPIGSQLSVQVEMVLNRLRLTEDVGLRHQSPVIASPSLRHHQQIGILPMLFIVRLEIILHIWDKALHIRREHHPRLHVALLAVGHRMGIHSRER